MNAPRTKTKTNTTTTSSSSKIVTTIGKLIRQILVSIHCLLSCYYGTASLSTFHYQVMQSPHYNQVYPFSFPAVRLRFLQQIMAFSAPSRLLSSCPHLLLLSPCTLVLFVVDISTLINNLMHYTELNC